MAIKTTAEEAERKVKDLNPHISLKYETYINSTTKCTWTDDRYGEFQKSATAMIFHRSAYHPKERGLKLSKARTKSLSAYLEDIKKINSEIKLINPEDYKNVQTKLLWINPGCDQPFKKSIYQMIRPSQKYRGVARPVFAHNTLSIDTIEARLKQKNINLTIKDTSIYKNGKSVLEWITPSGLIFKRSVALVLSGQTNHPDEIKNTKKPLEYFLNIIQKINPKITAVNPTEFKNSSSVLEWNEEGVGNFTRSVARMVHRTTHHPKTTQERMKKKFMENYGTDNPMKNEQVFKKSSQKANLVKFIEHWKTGEKLSCRGQYEYAVVSYLNYFKIDFKWQIAFTTPWNSVYNIDLYLTKEDKYVEIKGFWVKPDISKRKWEWFHSAYPNSEIWFKEDLVTKDILTKSGTPVYYSDILDKPIKRIKGRALRKKAICIETGEVFDSVTLAASAIGVSHSTLSANLTGKTKKCQGKTFIYYKT